MPRELPTESDRVVAIELDVLMVPPVVGTILHFDDNRDELQRGAAAVAFMAAMPWRAGGTAVEFWRLSPYTDRIISMFANGLQISTEIIGERHYERVTIHGAVYLTLSSRWPRASTSARRVAR